MILPSKVYNFLKPVSTTVLPGVVALYIALAQLWHWGAQVEVAGSVAAVNVFLGLLLTLSSGLYNNSDSRFAGRILVDDTDPDKTQYGLELNGHPADTLNKGTVEFKVRSVDSVQNLDPQL